MRTSKRGVGGFPRYAEQVQRGDLLPNVTYFLEDPITYPSALPVYNAAAAEGDLVWIYYLSEFERRSMIQPSAYSAPVGRGGIAAIGDIINSANSDNL